jgi:hypothetical protein
MRLLLLVLLAGCAALSPWDKPNASKQDFYTDDDLCQAQAVSSPKGPVNWREYDSCMVAKGWRKRG